MRRVLAVALAAAAVLTGCRIPDDPEGTLERVRGGTVRVGTSESEPWVRLRGGQPVGGVEVELVRRFARRVRAHVEWVDGSEEELVDALKKGSLDLAIAGFTNKSRWKRDVAFTRPYVETRTLVGAQPGRTLDGDLEGLALRVELGSEAEALARGETDARVIPVRTLSGARGPVAAEDYVLDDLGLRPTDIELKADKHVMAVRFGENAWLVELERFLLQREAEIRRLVMEEGRP